ncbi:hypothetical protein PM10SUCC1_09280 [Propionigenium maris DSM 9537]|uniref:Oxygen tolerance n=1 Tax=Propionigenium maris DSM 9537 TaxID=1123000 RepID=A0A9W6LM50_9FUSO|nr:BatD family protein [Propionigenium maris]GLI55414.1 hypothetical protein PM10SUCC1_09280 [Propionigenium maris DSM 9537]
MKPGKKLILFLLLCITNLLYGEIFIEADRSRIAVGETLNLRVTMEGKIKYDIENIENFRLLSHYSSSNKSIINGKSSSSYTDTYQAMALKEGTFPLKAVGGGEKSNTISIQVGAQSATPVSERKYFIQITPEREDYYFGEKIPYTESLVTTVSLQDIDYLERPSFGDISITDVNPGRRIGALQNRTKVGDREALNIVLYQGILEPSSSGSREIGGSVVRVSAEGRDFFSRHSENLAGEKRRIDILPLPEGAPADFKNIVGTLEGTSTLDRSSVAVGEAATLTVDLSGSGNLSSLKEIISGRSSDFSIYENIVNQEEWIEGDTYQNRKVFQVAFIPKKSGRLRTPEISIPYFDTRERKYKNFVVESREIEVDGDPAVVQGGTPVLPQVTASTESVEISVIPEPVPESTHKNWIIIALASLVIIQGGVILYLLRDRFRKGRGRIYSIKNLKRSKNNQEFYENYCAFMKERYNFNPKAQSGERLKSKELQSIHREVEEKRFRGEEIDRKKVIDELLKAQSTE